MVIKSERRNGEIDAALAAEISRQLAAHGVTGLSLALIRDQQLALTMAYGVRNAATGEPLTPQNVFEAYSLTKPLVAHRVLNLYQNGILDLDRPLDDYLDRPVIGSDPRSRLITARSILAHTSGLPDEETERQFVFIPGERWSYSTQGYCLLPQVIERVTAEPFDVHMQRHLLDPLAMTASSLVWKDRVAAVMAQGHDDQGIPQRDRQIRTADADSLLTTAADYARFVVASVWPDGRASIEPPSRLMRQPQVTVASDLSWGLGWGIETTADGAVLWHIGGGSGAPFQNFVMVNRGRGGGIVLLTNSANGGALFEPLVHCVTGERFALFNFAQAYFYS